MVDLWTIQHRNLFYFIWDYSAPSPYSQELLSLEMNLPIYVTNYLMGRSIKDQQGTSLHFSIITSLNLLFLSVLYIHFTVVWAEPKLSSPCQDLENPVQCISELLSSIYSKRCLSFTQLRSARHLEALKWSEGFTVLLALPSRPHHRLFPVSFLSNWSSRTGQGEGPDFKIKRQNIAYLSGTVYIFLVNSDNGCIKRCYFWVLQKPKLLILI